MAGDEPVCRPTGLKGVDSARVVLGDPPRGRQALGVYGEEVAAHVLGESGLEILDRNWRCSLGELDIVAREGSALVICEVKTRSGEAFGSPLDAVTAAKSARLRRLARCWLGDQQRWFADVRFDAVSVLCPHGANVTVEHVRGVC